MAIQQMLIVAFISVVFAGCATSTPISSDDTTSADKVGSAKPPAGTVVIGTAPSCDAHPSDCPTDFPNFISYLGAGGGHPCISGSKILCATDAFADDYKNYYWEGTAPFCSADKDDCSPNTYLMDDTSGPGAKCKSGHKVLCGIRE